MERFTKRNKTLPIREGVDFASNVPARMLVEISHLVADYSNVSISFSDKKALFCFGNTLVATRLVAGDYPNTRNIVPRAITRLKVLISQYLL